MAAYLRERFSLTVFLPLAAVTYATGCIATATPPTVWSATAGIATALLLILAFRVTDDLADRDADRARVPARISTRPEAFVPLLRLRGLALGGAAGIALADGGFATRVAIVIALHIALLVWYRVRDALGATPLANAHVVLAKYPLFALVVAPSPVDVVAADALPALLALYVGLCLYEAIDDATVRTSIGARPVMVSEAGLLVGLQLITLFR